MPLPSSGKSGGGLSSSTSSGGTTRSLPSSGGGGSLPSGGKKKSGGVLGGLKSVGGGALGAATDVLSIPQQVIFGLAHTAKAASGMGGNLADLTGGLKHAGKELLGGGEQNWDIAQTLGTFKGGEKGQLVSKKLGKGVNTGLTSVLDPLLFTGVGKGAEATEGVSRLSQLTGIGEKEISKGIKEGTIPMTRGSNARELLKTAVKKDILDNSPKVDKLALAGKRAEAIAYAEKKAEKIAKLTARRGGGGVSTFVPGSEKLSEKLGQTGFGTEGKLTQAIGGAAEKGGAAVKGSAVGQAVGKALIPGRELSSAVGERASKAIRSLGGSRISKATQRQSELASELRNGIEAVGRPLTHEDNADLLHALERGVGGLNDLKAAKPELEPLIETAARLRDTTTTEQIAAGVLDAARTHNPENYAARLVTSEAAKVLKEDKQAAKILSDAGGSAKSALSQEANRARGLFPDMPAREMNELKAAHDAGTDIRPLLDTTHYQQYVPLDPKLKDQMAKEFLHVADKLPKGTQLYQESGVGSLLSRGRSAIAATESANYIDSLKGITDELGNPVLRSHDDIAAAAQAAGGKFKVPEGWVPINLEGLGMHYAPKEVANEVAKVGHFVNSASSVENFDKAMQKWQQFWKVHATTGILGALPFAARNARSNVFLMMADGMKPADLLRYTKDARDLTKEVQSIMGESSVLQRYVGQHAGEVAAKGIKEVLKDKLGPAKYKLWQDLNEHGIVTQGFFDVEWEQGLDQALHKLGIPLEKKPNIVKKIVTDALGTQGKLAETGRNYNQMFEHNARIADYLYNLDKYGNPAKAAERVKTVLFDYSDLTPLEQKRLKWVSPFYTFMRKNLPLQFQTVVQNPARVLVPEKISHAVTQPLPENAPDYMKEQGSRVIPQGVPLIGGRVTTPDRPFEAALSQLNPLVQLAQGHGKTAARELANIPGGGQMSLGRNLAEVGTGTDLFTGGKVTPGAAATAQRLVGGQLPSLSRLPGRLGPVTNEKITGKSAKSKMTVTELLKLLTGLRAEKAVTGQGHK